MSLTLFSFNNKYFAQEAGKLATRDQIEPKYTWNLNDIYTSEQQWEADFKWLETNLANYKNYEGKLSSSAKALLECLKFDDELSIKLEKVYLYSSLAKDLDLANSKYQSMYDRTSVLYSKVGAAGSFIRPEILAIPDDKFAGFMKEESGLQLYAQVFDNLRRRKAHILPKEQEELMAMASQVMQTPENTFSMLSNADVQFPTVKDDKGNDFEISHGRFYAALYSNNREFRKRVYQGFHKPFITYKNTYATLFNGNLKANIFNARARKYNSAREASLDVNNVPVSVYDNLVNSINQNLQPLHRWAEMKKKVLGVSELHLYDAYVTLFPGSDKKYTFEEGKKLVLEALKPMGEQYIKDLQFAFDNRWIDVYETKGKRSGAYSSGSTYKMHPYVLLNWTDQLNDVFTLAHELGHNMHSFYTGNKQPYPYANYSIFLAEVASTYNEALLLDYLIEKAQTKAEKLSLIEKYLMNLQTTFYRQTMFAEFEQLVHEKTEGGASLSAEDLCALYREITSKYWGPAMTVDEEEDYTWARIPHFYYNFYVFQYSTGFAASQALAAKAKKEGKPAVDTYIKKFLQAGSSKYPLEILKDAGVDMNSSEPVLATAKKMNELLDQMEALLNEK